MWYKIVHDFVPNNVVLHKAYPKANDQCRLCINANNLLHRVATCGDAEGIWCWIRTRLPMLQRMDPRLIPSQWLIFTNFSCGHNQIIMPQSGFWCIWHTTHSSTAHSCRRQMTSISYGSPDEKIVTGVNGTRFMGITLTSVTELFSHLLPATVFVPLRGACGIFQHSNKDCNTNSMSLIYV